MTISRTNGSGWSVLDKLTSAQINAMDIADTYAADKRSGQTDIIQAVWTASGAGRLVYAPTTGADANTTYSVNAGVSSVLPGALTAPRTYTLSTTGAVTGDRVVIVANASYDITVLDASTTQIGIVGAKDTGLGQVGWGEFNFNGTVWALVRTGISPKASIVTRGKAVALIGNPYGLQ